MRQRFRFAIITTLAESLVKKGIEQSKIKREIVRRMAAGKYVSRSYIYQVLKAYPTMYKRKKFSTYTFTDGDKRHLIKFDAVIPQTSSKESTIVSAIIKECELYKILSKGRPRIVVTFDPRDRHRPTGV